MELTPARNETLIGNDGALRVSERILKFRPPRIAIGMLLIAIASHAWVPLSLLTPFLLTGLLTAVAGFGLMIRAWWLFKVHQTAIAIAVGVALGAAIGRRRN